MKKKSRSNRDDVALVEKRIKPLISDLELTLIAVKG